MTDRVRTASRRATESPSGGAQTARSSSTLRRACDVKPLLPRRFPAPCRRRRHRHHRSGAARGLPRWPPNRDYSLPWQSGMTGIGYDPKKVGGDIDSIDELLTNPKLKGKVTFLTEFGDTMGLVMLANGDDPSKVTNASFARAVAKIKK